MRSYVLTATLLMAVSGFALNAHAETSKADEFVKKAVIAGQFEIDSSKVALERSANPEVKAFAQQMIDDHTKVDGELKDTLKQASLSGITAPTGLDEKHQKIVDKLKTVEASKFDKDYLDEQEDAHEKTVDLFEHYSEKGDNAELKAFAAKTLPDLKAHHEKAEALEKSEKHAEK